MKFRLLIICLLFQQSIYGQLSGSYTIGGTTGASNFATWADFATALANTGVSGNVSVKVMADASITAFVKLVQHSSNPTTSSKKIVIDGNSKKLSGGLGSELIGFDGADFIEIKNLTLVNSSTSTAVQGFRFSNAADDNTITACSVEFSGSVTTGGLGAAYVSFASSQTAVTTTSTTNNGSRNVISGCNFYTSASNVSGPVYGIIDQQGTGSYKSTGTENIITGNVIKNFHSYGIFVKYANGEEISKNDLSRANAGSKSPCDTLIRGIFAEYVYGSNKSLAISSNQIHDLPYVGAQANSTSNYVSKFLGIHSQYCAGSSTRNLFIDGNVISRIVALNNTCGVEVISCDFVSVLKNKLLKCVAYYSGTSYGISAAQNNDFIVSGNMIRGGNYGYSKSGDFYAIYIALCYSKSYSYNRCEDNFVDSNTATDLCWALRITDAGSWQINRNKVVFNVTTSTTNGSAVGLYMEFLENVSVNSNLFLHNMGETEAAGIYSINYNSGYTLEIRQNTVFSRASNTSNTVVYGYYIEDEGTILFVGNLLDIAGGYVGYPINIFSSNKIKEINHNTSFVSFGSGDYWGLENNGYASFADYKASGIVGSGENFLNPLWKDIAKNDFRSGSFKTQNNVSTVSNNVLDVMSAKRNAVKCDRGAVENFMDLAVVKTSVSIPTQVCSGYQTKMDVTVKNKFSDTAMKFYIAYSVNGVATRQLVSNKILPNDSLKISFTLPLNLNIVGVTKVKIYLDIPDDNVGNDTITLTTTVKSAPGGGKIDFSSKVQSGNNPVYQRGKPLDVTILGVPVIYNVSSPRSYTNANYGTGSGSKWNASVQAYTSAGKTVSGATLIAPSASADMEVQFKTTDANLEDSLLNLAIKISDLSNGCDTFLRRQVLVYSSVTTDFTYPTKICLGDTVNFINASKNRSGYYENLWSYGTGVSSDTSNNLDGYFVFTKSGNHQITLKTTTNPYGFVFSKSYTIFVNVVPKVSYSRQNACLGDPVKFVNQTTPSSAKMYWDFGDGNGYVLNNNTNIAISYKNAGTYIVTLKADVGGCDASATQKVYQFEKPLAAFSKLSGRCDLDKFEFQNKSTIGTGLLGYKWYFDNKDSTSNETNPKFKFAKSGSKVVKLVVFSEFGCKDSNQLTVTVFESPKVSFTHTDPCSRTITEFSNSTPEVSGAVPNYSWDFGDGTSSIAKSPSHNWTSLGKKTVVLKVSLNNGCANQTIQDLDVRLQPLAAFTATNVCSGDAMNFNNQSSSASGKLTYKWDFSDNTTSFAENPIKTFLVKQTTNYNVTLVVYLEGGCADSITKTVSVQELPRTCDFEATTDYGFSYYGMKIVPKDDAGVMGGQAGIDYTFSVSGLGGKTAKDVSAMANFDLQTDGKYSVTIRSVVRGSNCECSKTKDFVMDRLTVNTFSNTKVVVYPNPASNRLTVLANGVLGKISWSLFDAVGKVVIAGSENQFADDLGNRIWEIGVEQLVDGVYFLRVGMGESAAVHRVMVQHYQR